MKDFTEFEEFYRIHGRCMNDIQPRKNPLNEAELRTRYKQYCKSEQLRLDRVATGFKKASNKRYSTTKEDIIDDRWERVREIVLKRDSYECCLMNLVNYYDDYLLMVKNGGSYIKIIDVAHVLSRSTYPKLKYEPDNLVCLNRYSHSLMDTSCDPITGEPITFVETMSLWVDILGKSQYNRLLQLLKTNNLGNPF